MHWDSCRLRHDPAVEAKHGRRVVEHLADDLRMRGTLDRCRHLLRCRDKPVADHLQRDRVEGVASAGTVLGLRSPAEVPPRRERPALHELDDWLDVDPSAAGAVRAESLSDLRSELWGRADAEAFRVAELDRPHRDDQLEGGHTLGQ